jgi:hypothetical protein
MCRQYGKSPAEEITASEKQVTFEDCDSERCVSGTVHLTQRKRKTVREEKWRINETARKAETEPIIAYRISLILFLVYVKKQSIVLRHDDVNLLPSDVYHDIQAQFLL